MKTSMLILFSALVNLAFPYDYVEAADSVLSECKIAAENKLKRKNSRLDKCGIPEDQLYLMQQKLIEKVWKTFNSFMKISKYFSVYRLKDGSYFSKNISNVCFQRRGN